MGDKIHKLVLTGAPGAGKSTSLDYIRSQALPGVMVVPEAATILLSGGYPVPDEENPWTEDWQWTFQEALMPTLLAQEKVYMERAKRLAKKVLIFDRGVIDGAAFLPNGVNDLIKITRTAEVDMLARYDQVIHLSSMNLSDDELVQGNPHRLRDHWRSQELEDKTLEAWKHHPNRQIISDSNRHRGEIILEMIQPLL